MSTDISFILDALQDSSAVEVQVRYFSLDNTSDYPALFPS